MRTRRAGESALLLLDAIEVLASEAVDYAVIDAMAASVHGVLRASMDADAVLSITTQELGKLEQRFKAAGLKRQRFSARSKCLSKERCCASSRSKTS